MDAAKARGYESISDVNELAIVLRELGRAGQWIGLLADQAIEDVDVPPDCVRGIRMARAVVDKLAERAGGALEKLVMGDTAASPSTTASRWDRSFKGDAA